MKHIYFIDSENVGDSWLPLLAREEDDILVFYTSKSPYMSYDGLVLLKESPKDVTFIKCFEGTNALDFQLVSELGYRLNSETDSEFIIVTNDTGYDAAVRYWQKKEFPVKRVQSKAVKNFLEQLAKEEKKAQTALTTIESESTSQDTHSEETAEPTQKEKSSSRRNSRRRKTSDAQATVVEQPAEETAEAPVVPAAPENPAPAVPAAEPAAAAPKADSQIPAQYAHPEIPSVSAEMITKAEKIVEETEEDKENADAQEQPVKKLSRREQWKLRQQLRKQRQKEQAAAKAAAREAEALAAENQQASEDAPVAAEAAISEQVQEVEAAQEVAVAPETEVTQEVETASEIKPVEEVIEEIVREEVPEAAALYQEAAEEVTEAPVEKTPVAQETPAEETPVEETPVEETPAAPAIIRMEVKSSGVQVIPPAFYSAPAEEESKAEEVPVEETPVEITADVVETPVEEAEVVAETVEAVVEVVEEAAVVEVVEEAAVVEAAETVETETEAVKVAETVGETGEAEVEAVEEAVVVEVAEAVEVTEIPSPETVEEANPVEEAAETEVAVVEEAVVVEAAVEETVPAEVTEVAEEAPSFNKKEVDTLINCIGKNNLGDIHNALELFYGEEGKDIYQVVRSNSYVPEIKKWHKNIKFQKYCGIVFAHSDLGKDKPKDFDKFLYANEEKRKNLNSLRAALQNEYGKDLGMRLYSLFKAHIKVLNKM